MSRSRLNSLPIGALRAFEAASRLGSFKAAATELAVTPAAVSHQIKSLEAALALSLFERLHRSLRLTPAGEQLARAAHEAFRTLERSLSSLADQGKLGGPASLSVSAATSIAAKWLAPRLHRFHTLHPHIDLRLQGEDRRVDLAREPGTDVALRYGPEPDDHGVEVIQLWAPGKIVMVCAPAIVERGELRDPADVLRFSLLRTAQPTPRAAGGELFRRLNWATWLNAAGLGDDAPLGPHFGSTQLTVEAAMAGQGLALTPEILVIDDLHSGRLAQPFDISIPDAFSYWLLCRRDRSQEARIRAFRNWVLSEAAAEPK
ncbi:LysR substrate-binding domain-containing protein [Sphingomonas sp. URHD0057]|uniref:LysR substrate-binding domain-containing protein n=1 Tax=Sphingomonas sp. URHD0057 TaxID=1380389 RepID=UPI00048CCB6F|nr:LysR substrate-binding domain-containing protein [Sphingomonas sp. URHD0057]